MEYKCAVNMCNLRRLRIVIGFDEVYSEHCTNVLKMLADILLKKMPRDYKCEIVYKRHGYSKKLLDLVRLDMLRCERLSCIAVFCSQKFAGCEKVWRELGAYN
jgi:hypothetical protein